MDVYEAMSTLRAVRRLKPDPIPADVVERVLQAAAWAPTGGNNQPFRIISISDREKLQAMQAMYAESWHGYTAAMRERLGEVPQATERALKAGDYLADHWGELPLLLVFCFNPKMMAITDANLDRPSVVGGGSVYTAVQNVMLACRTEGLGCVLTTLLCYHEAAVKDLLNVPEDWFTCAHVPIGYPVLKGHGPISRRTIGQLVHDNSWQS